MTHMLPRSGETGQKDQSDNRQCMLLLTNAGIIPVNLGQLALPAISSSTLTDHYENINRALVRTARFSHID